ncbi:MAG: hypothetical protein IPG79_20605 [Saprospiraceae bacterium]|nr:hypothetical protein [Saprospiraceae bacterium]
MKVIREALELAEKNGFKENEMKAHSHLASLYEDQKKFKEAYFHFNKFYRLQDTLFNQQKDETINELLVKYETEKKDAEIVLLNTENELKTCKFPINLCEKGIDFRIDSGFSTCLFSVAT